MAAPIPASQLTYLWPKEWKQMRDGSWAFSGGCFFVVGKYSTVGELGLVSGNKYTFTFQLKYQQDDPIQVGLIVKTNNQYLNNDATISKSTGLILVSTQPILIGDNFDDIEIILVSKVVKNMKGIYVYSVNPFVA